MFLVIEDTLTRIARLRVRNRWCFLFSLRGKERDGGSGHFKDRMTKVRKSSVGEDLRRERCFREIT
jgi:hypothetical protein